MSEQQRSLVEMSSNYVAEFNSSSSSKLNSSSCSADQSLNGLKFGKKIYFEDVGFAAPSKSGGALSVSLSTPPKKVKVVAVQGAAQPPRCQVRGCEVDLSDAKAYYSRHKVCSMHSKSPSVVVAGLEQRFCQQCSRFHQLPEFDQGKRSCRRRLAGHNERRRKPPPGSLFNSQYGRLSSSVFESHGRVGGLLMDFTAYPKLATIDSWPSSKYPEQVFGNQTSSVTGKRLPRCLQGNSGSPPSDIFMQGSIGGTNVPIEKIHPGECFTSMTDSSCALSLLSNQPWGSRNQAFHVGLNNVVNFEGSAITQPIAPHPHSAPIHNIPSSFWCFKGNEAGGSSHETVTDIGLSQITQPFAIQRSGDAELSEQSARQYVEIENSRPYPNSQQMHWSL